MGDDYTPPGMIRLTTEIDRLTGDGNKTPAPSVLKPTRRRGATVSASDILTGSSDLQSIMKAVRAGQAAAEDARRREAETVDRRLRGWGALRRALASGTRRGWWWFFDFDGRTEAIDPGWWNSSAAEDAASRGTTTLMLALGEHVHSFEVVVVLEEEAPPRNEEPAPVVTTSKEPQQTAKNRGGRPRVYKWDEGAEDAFAFFSDNINKYNSCNDDELKSEIKKRIVNFVSTAENSPERFQASKYAEATYNKLVENGFWKPKLP